MIEKKENKIVIIRYKDRHTVFINGIKVNFISKYSINYEVSELPKLVFEVIGDTDIINARDFEQFNALSEQTDIKIKIENEN